MANLEALGSAKPPGVWNRDVPEPNIVGALVRLLRASRIDSASLHASAAGANALRNSGSFKGLASPRRGRWRDIPRRGC
jgi:hypothetical protein